MDLMGLLLLPRHTHISVTSTSSTVSTSPPSDDGQRQQQQQDLHVIMKGASSSLTALSLLISKKGAAADSDFVVGSVDTGRRRVSQADDDLLFEAETALALSAEGGGGINGREKELDAELATNGDDKADSGSSVSSTTSSSRDGEVESPLEISPDAIGAFELEELDNI